jgi:FkbM family methyltransferase
MERSNHRSEQGRCHDSGTGGPSGRRFARRLVRFLLSLRSRFFPKTEFSRLPLLRSILPGLVRAARCEYVDNIHGHRIYLDDRDSLGLSTNPDFEPIETALFAEAVGVGEIAVDIGANIGYYTLLFAKRVGAAGRVIAFEPDPDNCRILARNLAESRYENVTICPAAVSDTDATLQLFRSAANRMDHRTYDAGEAREMVTVPAVSLDVYFADNLRPIHWIKMDIQGAELRALRGMKGVLRANPEIVLVTEYWPYGLACSGADPAEYLAELAALGFQLEEIDERAKRVGSTTPQALARFNPSDKWDSTNLVCRRPRTA